MSTPIRALIVDDSQIAQRATYRALELIGNIKVVGYAANGREALEQVRNLWPDLVLMDLEMPVMNGLEATLRIRERFPKIRVIVVTVNDSPLAREICESFGAHGFVTKESLYPELERAIAKAFQHGQRRSGTAASKPSVILASGRED